MQYNNRFSYSQSDFNILNAIPAIDADSSNESSRVKRPKLIHCYQVSKDDNIVVVVFCIDAGMTSKC